MSDYVTVTIRVHRDVKASWVSQAELEGLSVGKLIQKAMSSGLLDATIVSPQDRPTVRPSYKVTFGEPKVKLGHPTAAAPFATTPALTDLQTPATGLIAPGKTGGRTASPPPVVPMIPGVKKASELKAQEFKPPMPKVEKYVPKPQPKKVKK